MNHLEELIPTTKLLRDIKDYEDGDRIFYKTSVGYQEITMYKAWAAHIKPEDLVKFDYRILKKEDKKKILFNVTVQGATYYKLTRDNLLKQLANNFGLTPDRVYLIDTVFIWTNSRGRKKVFSDWLHDCQSFSWFDEPIYLREKSIKIEKYHDFKIVSIKRNHFHLLINKVSFYNYSKERILSTLKDRLSLVREEFAYNLRWLDDDDNTVKFEDWLDDDDKRPLYIKGKGTHVSITKGGLTTLIKEKDDKITTKKKPTVVNVNYKDKDMNLKKIDFLPPQKNEQCQGKCNRRLIGVKDDKGIVWCWGCNRLIDEIDIKELQE